MTQFLKATFKLNRGIFAVALPYISSFPWRDKRKNFFLIELRGWLSVIPLRPLTNEQPTTNNQPLIINGVCEFYSSIPSFLSLSGLLTKP